ncbi:hypothetical protein HYW20_00915 [Candidatus Woesearchaeota archaeon]|nr:hypothetical protein [Candidatus Woesearchaeota archaeon]
MGFLRFLKREKREKEFHELDLPPAPPSLEGFEDDTPKLPDFPDIDEKPDGKDIGPQFNFPEEGDNLSEFPSLAELEETLSPIPPVRAPPAPKLPPLSEPLPEPEQAMIEENPEMQDAMPIKDNTFFREEENILGAKQKPWQAMKSGRTIYLRVDKFRSVLGNINMIRNDLKKSEDALMKLENMKNAEYKSFDKMKSSLEDLQKKITFVDKTLFKGD